MDDAREPDDPILDRLVGSLEHLRFLRLDGSGAVLEANDALARDLGTTPDAIRGAPLADVVPVDDAERVEGWIRDGLPDEPVVLNVATEESVPVSLRCVLARRDGDLLVIGEPMAGFESRASERMLRLNNDLAVLSRENARRRRELERALEELETTHWHLKKVQEHLPLCMECGKVKADEPAGWRSLVDYLRENEIYVTHGYCPACAAAYAREHGLEEAP